MRLEEILNAEPTLSPNNAKGLFAELFQMPWRTYSSAKCPETMYWLGRYLNAHARVPGLVTEATFALFPIDVFHITVPLPHDQQLEIHGAVFLNGAIIEFRGELEPVYALMVDEDTAKLWSYPEHGYEYAPQAFAAMREAREEVVSGPVEGDSDLD